MRQKHFLTKTALLTASVIFFLIFNQALAETVAAPDHEIMAEPIIRVGLYKTDKAVKFTSDFIYDVWINGEMAGVLLAQDTVILSYKNGVYSLASDSLAVTSSNYIRLMPEDAYAFFTLANYNRPVKGRGKVNFNVYRGALEYRYSPKSKLPYIINELPLDFYVAGVAETHDAAPTEYVKALMVAARSYA